MKRDPQLLQLQEFRIPSGPRKNRDIPSGSYYCIDSVWENEVIDVPLNKRAWVFQERYLSPRILHFGARQVFWECMESEACEMFPSSMPKPFATSYKKEASMVLEEAASSSRGNRKRRLLKTWCDIVRAYSAGRLTMQSDKLVALSGVTQAMHASLQSEYLAGLWHSGLLRQLLWYVPEGEQVTRSSTY